MLNTSLALMSRLAMAGHTISCGCPSPVKEKVEQAGFKFHPLAEFYPQPAPSHPSFSGLFAKVRKATYLLLKYRARAQVTEKRLGQEFFLQLIEKEKPDLLIIDIELHAYIFTAYGLKIPSLLLCTRFVQFRMEGIPPINSNIIPDGSHESLNEINRAWASRKNKMKRKNRKLAIHHGFVDRRSVLLRYAKKQGFPLAFLCQYGWPPPFTHRALPTIHTNLPQLEFTNALPHHLHYVGPMISTRRLQAKVSPALAKAFKQKEQDNSRLIYCTIGTMGVNRAHFLERLVQAVAQETSWTLIVSLGDGTSLPSQKEDFKNIHFFKSVPQLIVIKKADLVIHHGGINTANECIFFGKPMLIYSGEQHDQNGTCSRMVAHGLALYGDPKNTSADQFRKDINEVLNTASYREKAMAFQQLSKSSSTTNRLQQVVERMLKATDQ